MGEKKTMGLTTASPLNVSCLKKKKKAPNICSTILFKGYDESLQYQGPKILHSEKKVFSCDWLSANLPLGCQAYLETLTSFQY